MNTKGSTFAKQNFLKSEIMKNHHIPFYAHPNRPFYILCHQMGNALSEIKK